MIYSPTFSHGELYARNMSRVLLLAEEQYDEMIKSRIDNTFNISSLIY